MVTSMPGTEEHEGKGFADLFLRAKWKGYHSIWLWIFLAWMMLYIDRSITGPVVSWMIANDVAFMAAAPMPHALGGIIGSFFFAGYMLTQFPAGYLGDRWGHKIMIVISLIWSSVATFLSGVARDLTVFVSTRILTGLGEGAYYSNDRAFICSHTPEEKKGMGLGIVFVGLAVGLTLATVLTPIFLDSAASMMGKESAWSFPFLLFSLPTLLLAAIIWKWVGPREPVGKLLKAGSRLVLYAAIFLAVLMGAYLGTLHLGLDSVAQASFLLLAVFALVAVIYARLGLRSNRALRDRNLLVVYVSAIPILYTLWFFGFWAVLVISESSKLGISGAAVYAALFGVASAIGYPLGGRICDAVRTKENRKKLYIILTLAVALMVFLVAVAISIHLDVLLFGLLIFAIGAVFSAAQTAHMTLTADLAPRENLGQAFGMWNLVGEVGAVLSPVISGVLRDATGDWTLAIMVNGALLIVSAVLVSVVSTGDRTAFVPGAAGDRR